MELATGRLLATGFRPIPPVRRVAPAVQDGGFNRQLSVLAKDKPADFVPYGGL